MDDIEKQNLKNKIKLWNIREIRKNLPKTALFCDFFIYYMCLDAWLTIESGMDIDKKKIKWFKDNSNLLKNSFSLVKNAQVEGWLNQIKDRGRIEDLRPNHNEPKSLNDITDINQIFDVLYLIRCNLFHGSKDPNNPGDQDLVSTAGKILKHWVYWGSRKCL